MRRTPLLALCAPWALGVGLLLASCAASLRPQLDELPLRSVETCGVSWDDEDAPADVVLAIDTSQSTARPAGADIDGDGVTGRFTRSVMTDSGDSLLAAQVAGVRSLLRSGRHRSARFSIVTYAGRTRFPSTEPPLRLVPAAEGAVRAELTGDLAALESALDTVLAGGSRGKTNFAAALRLALRTLEKAPAPEAPRRRLVLLLSDSPNPVVAGPSESHLRTSRRLAYPRSELVHLARRALRSRVPIHTFGLGPAADTDPPHALSSLAKVTGGTYRAVGDPERLHCALLGALAS